MLEYHRITCDINNTFFHQTNIKKNLFLITLLTSKKAVIDAETVLNIKLTNDNKQQKSISGWPYGSSSLQ
jgi:hypothetical protein